jgi:hypothetical protein
MTRTRGVVAGLVTAALAVVGAGAQNAWKLSATLVGTGEIPAVSTPARGSFSAEIQGDSVAWSLTYSGLEGDVLQSHIHFAQPFTNGGIVVWLCRTSQPAPPAPAALPQTCPQSGTITGVFTADDVVGPASPNTQGIEPGDFSEVVRAMRAGLAYVNVHSSIAAGGEIRGQVKTGAGH